MSAVLKDAAHFAPMREADLPAVLEIENAIYSHPWTRGNFLDSMRAGYQCRTLRSSGSLQGYFILAGAAGEAHLLNLSVAGSEQRRGHGSALLREAMRLCAEHGGRRLFLEVRPSNPGAQALYSSFGFQRIAVRRGYYPAQGGREDALVYTLTL